MSLAILSLVLTIAAHAAVFVALRRRKLAEHAPPVTILKPVKGDEPGLYENLASLAAQDYPDFEILVGAEDARDPALEVARRVQAAFPQVRIVIRAGARRLGLNPKVNLLAALCEVARNDLVLISDSNVRAPPGYLRETAAELADPRVGLVTNLLAGAGGAALENLHLNAFVASAQCLARVAAGRSCVIGKSMLFRQSDLAKLGGFRSVADVLAEDYVIGRKFELAGHRVALSPCLLEARSDGWTLERFLNRHIRWAQMRRRVAPVAYAGEILLNPIPLALAAGPQMALAAIALKCLGDAIVWRRLRGEWPGLRELCAIPAKDLLVAGIWLAGAFKRRVSWRGNLLVIEAGSRLTALEAA